MWPALQTVGDNAFHSAVPTLHTIGNGAFQNTSVIPEPECVPGPFARGLHWLMNAVWPGATGTNV